VRARVAGYLDKILFADGAEVHEGDPLFQIDPRTYEADLAKAKAQVEQTKARYDRLCRQYDRGKRLLETRAISREDFELTESERAEAAANIEAAQAVQRLAELNVGFTTVKSPVHGRISRRLVDVGNLVRPDDTMLATIVTLDPIYAYFDINERTVLQLRRSYAAADGRPLAEQGIEVDLTLADEDQASIKGVIDYTDNELDANTGTLRVRVAIKNSDAMLSPGFFVRCRMPVGEARDSLCVPEEALGSDQGQRFLYVVNGDNEVSYRRVDVGPLLAGWRVIHQNLASDERVIVSGLQRVRPGQEVKVKFDPAYGRQAASSTASVNSVRAAGAE
jgi:RND family efflux transporter MFP subunit